MQFGWPSREEAARAWANMDESAEAGDRITMERRAFYETSSRDEQVAARVYNVHNSRTGRTMKTIHCKICDSLVGVVDLPTAETLKKMVTTAKPTDAKMSLMLTAAQGLLPMLPPEAFDFVATTIPYYCPTCVVEYQIGQHSEGEHNGERISEGARGPSGAGERSAAGSGGTDGEVG